MWVVVAVVANVGDDDNDDDNNNNNNYIFLVKYVIYGLPSEICIHYILIMCVCSPQPSRF